MLKHYFSAILEFRILNEVRKKEAKFRKTEIFEHNPAPNCFTVKNSYTRGLDLNDKKAFLAILEFSIEREKITKFRKNQFFERNSAPIYISVTKFHMKRLNLNIKK